VEDGIAAEEPAKRYAERERERDVGEVRRLRRLLWLSLSSGGIRAEVTGGK
jgi:hypothetical protein